MNKPIFMQTHVFALYSIILFFFYSFYMHDDKVNWESSMNRDSFCKTVTE